MSSERCFGGFADHNVERRQRVVNGRTIFGVSVRSGDCEVYHSRVFWFEEAIVACGDCSVSKKAPDVWVDPLKFPGSLLTQTAQQSSAKLRDANCVGKREGQ